ncbi:hypothetical protein F4U94_04210 [Sphingobium limneticum]|nr:hypothetical protein F4U94_04210 [Sphingobium limneticum]
MQRVGGFRCRWHCRRRCRRGGWLRLGDGRVCPRCGWSATTQQDKARQYHQRRDRSGDDPGQADTFLFRRGGSGGCRFRAGDRIGGWGRERLGRLRNRRAAVGGGSIRFCRGRFGRSRGCCRRRRRRARLGGRRRWRGALGRTRGARFGRGRGLRRGRRRAWTAGLRRRLHRGGRRRDCRNDNRRRGRLGGSGRCRIAIDVEFWPLLVAIGRRRGPCRWQLKTTGRRVALLGVHRRSQHQRRGEKQRTNMKPHGPAKAQEWLNRK